MLTLGRVFFCDGRRGGGVEKFGPLISPRPFPSPSTDPTKESTDGEGEDERKEDSPLPESLLPLESSSIK